MKLETEVKYLFKAESQGRNKQTKEVDTSFNPIFRKIEMGANYSKEEMLRKCGILENKMILLLRATNSCKSKLKNLQERANQSQRMKLEEQKQEDSKSEKSHI